MVATGLRPRGRLALATLLVCGSAALTGRAEAPPRVALAWERSPAAASCATREAAVQMVQRRLRRAPFAEGPADFTIDAAIDQPARDHWEATFVVRKADGSLVGRRILAIDAPSCRSLDGPMALVLTLLTEAPERAAEASGASASATPASAAPSAAPSASVEAPPPIAAAPPPVASATASAPPVEPSTSQPLSGSIFAAAVLASGSVPGLGAGARLGGSLGSTRLRARVELTYQPGDTTPEDGPGARVSLAQAGLAGCGRSGALLGPVQAEGCVGLRVGLAQGRGANLSHESSAALLVHGLTAQGALIWPLGPLALRASLGAQAATARARFFYDTPAGPTTAWQAGRLQPEADLALEFRFGP